MGKLISGRQGASQRLLLGRTCAVGTSPRAPPSGCWADQLRGRTQQGSGGREGSTRFCGRPRPELERAEGELRDLRKAGAQEEVAYCEKCPAGTARPESTQAASKGAGGVPGPCPTLGCTYCRRCASHVSASRAARATTTRGSAGTRPDSAPGAPRSAPERPAHASRFANSPPLGAPWSSGALGTFSGHIPGLPLHLGLQKLFCDPISTPYQDKRDPHPAHLHTALSPLLTLWESSAQEPRIVPESNLFFF